MSEAGTVLLERLGPISRITLNRPERRNGLTVEMCARFYETVEEVAASDARVLIVAGAGRDFSVGADVHAGPSGMPPPSGEALGPIHHAASLLHTMHAVTIAAIDGGCAGAGLGYALACDLRFATPRARFSTAFITVGVSGDMGLGWSLDRLVGPARARELLFFSPKFGGEDALRMGLVTRLHAPEVLHVETMAAAETLCARDWLALRHMKANCVSAEMLDIADYVTIETRRHLECTARPGFAAAMGTKPDETAQGPAQKESRG